MNDARSVAAVLGWLLLWSAGACKDDSAATKRKQDASVAPRDGGAEDAAIRDDSGSGSGIEPADALTGACMMMGVMGADGQECEGLGAYRACALDECGLQDCLDDVCSDAVTCLQGASNVCNNDCFGSISTQCQQCLASSGMCAMDSCFELLMCGDVTEGGPCDQLDECCSELPADMVSGCQTAANGARAGGDETCAMAMAAICM